MADEQMPNPEGIVPGAPAPRPGSPFPSDMIVTGAPPVRSHDMAATAPMALAEVSPHHSETVLFLRWMAGMLLLLVFGWAFIIGGGAFVSRRLDIHMPWEVRSALSFVFLYLLETNLWLSRFMGLRISPHATPFKETLLLWLFGVPGLLLRSTAGERPASTVIKSSGESDGTREIVETVVFVVVLVLMLKTFLAEAFVIPTGSMADTLLGYHKEITCKECGYRFLVNCSSEVDPQPHQFSRVNGGICPNCQLPNHVAAPLPPPRGGMNP